RKEDVIQPHGQHCDFAPESVDNQDAGQLEPKPEGLRNSLYRSQVMPPPEMVQAFIFPAAHHSHLGIGLVTILSSKVWGMIGIFVILRGYHLRTYLLRLTMDTCHD